MKALQWGSLLDIEDNARRQTRDDLQRAALHTAALGDEPRGGFPAHPEPMMAILFISDWIFDIGRFCGNGK